jgi:hypothetical protein
VRLLPAIRAAILVAAVGLAVLAVRQTIALSGQRDELVGTALDLRLDDPGILRLMERAEDPHSARALLAREALTRALLEPSDQAAGGDEELRERRLDAAERLARESLARRPASWRAALVAGLAPYARWSLDRDPRLLQEYRRWEAPLDLAVRLAPGQDEPVRHLATAYLDLWPALSDAKRERARELLARALQEPAAFRQLLDPWLDVSDNDLSPIPDAPWAWTALQDTLSRRRDWPSFCRAWTVRRRALHVRLSEEIAEGERLVETDRLLAGRTVLLAAAAAAPVDARFAPLVDRALRSAPYGPGRPDLAAPFAAWLEWALERELHGAAPGPLSPETLARLRGVVMAGSDDPGHRAAAVWTYLAGDDWRGAERSERGSGARWSEPWAPYWVVKGRRLVARGELDAARRALAEVHPDWQGHPAFRLARRALAQAEGAPAFEVPPAPVGDEAWSWRGTRARLDPLLEEPAAGLEISLAEVPDEGAAVAIRWDGEVLGCRAVDEPGPLTVDRPIAPGLHLLELETLGAATGRVAPGQVRVSSR